MIKLLSKKRFLSFTFLSIPVVLFTLPFLLTGNLISAGDGDYLMQTQLAARISILDYGQFPWWNPWVSGGVPLFANPQFGLISIITPLAMLFGPIMGYKLGIALLFLIGFWGFRLFFIKSLNTPHLTATLLAYTWTFGSFLTNRAAGGHFTFLTIQLFPWLLLFLINRKKIRLSWLWFGITLGLAALSAAHNITIMCYMVLGLMFLYSSFSLVFSGPKIKQTFSIELWDIMFWSKSLLVFILLTFYRLFYTYQYLSDFPRSQLTQETSSGLTKFIFSLFGPLRQYTNTPSLPEWSWMEASTYISIFSGLALAIIIAIAVKNSQNYRKLFSFSPIVLLSLFITFTILGLGSFMGKLSPYLLLRMLPIFSSMRVSTRWYVWSAIIVIVFIASYKGSSHRKAINILLLLASIELFIYSSPRLAHPYNIPMIHERPQTSSFEQRKFYNHKRNGIAHDENFTEATMNNYGQVIAGDSLVDTRWAPPFGVKTKRCAMEEGCSLVLTQNADIQYWSPNKIVINRTGSGPIKIDINPGKYWRVNGVYTYNQYRTVEPDADFVINSDSDTITLDYVPRFSPTWFKEKLF